MTSIIMSFSEWLANAEKERNQAWSSLGAKDARETKTYLKTDKETLKKRLYEYLYDNYFEFVGENQLTPEEYYEEFKRVIEDELKRTNKERGFAEEMHSIFFKDTLPQPFVF